MSPQVFRIPIDDATLRINDSGEDGWPSLWAGRPQSGVPVTCHSCHAQFPYEQLWTETEYDDGDINEIDDLCPCCGTAGCCRVSYESPIDAARRTGVGIAFSSALIECCRNREFLQEYDRLHGTNLSFRGSAIEIAIDLAACRQQQELRKFAVFVWNTVFLPTYWVNGQWTCQLQEEIHG